MFFYFRSGVQILRRMVPKGYRTRCGQGRKRTRADDDVFRYNPRSTSWHETRMAPEDWLRFVSFMHYYSVLRNVRCSNFLHIWLPKRTFFCRKKIILKIKNMSKNGEKKQTIKRKVYLNVSCVLVVLHILCCLFLYGPFCHALKLDPIYIVCNSSSLNSSFYITNILTPFPGTPFSTRVGRSSPADFATQIKPTPSWHREAPTLYQARRRRKSRTRLLVRAWNSETSLPWSIMAIARAKTACRFVKIVGRIPDNRTFLFLYM